MTVADAPATLVWLDPQPPDASRSQAIAAWARAHGVIVAPPSKGSARAIVVDPARAEATEGLLERVRDAMAARDAEASDRALASAEAELRAHPELPQAAWLMAEVERARSSRFRVIPPLDLDAADRAWARAEALDGGRVTGVGEATSGAHPADASITLSLEPSGETVWLDSRLVTGTVIPLHAGPHVVVVTSDDLPVWAGWIETPSGPSTLHLALPAAPPCSAGDVAHARASRVGVDASEVRCNAWVAALAGSRPGAVTLAVCDAGRCGPLLEWGTGAAWTWTPPPDHPSSSWPTWATWGLVGAGAVVVTSVVLAASGAFQSAPAQSRFASGGLKTQSE